MSTINAHLRVTLMFEKIEYNDVIGLPIHLAKAKIFWQNLLLSKGAWSKSPIVGSIQVPIVFEEILTPVNSCYMRKRVSENAFLPWVEHRARTT